MREIFLPGKRKEGMMLGGFGHGGLSPFCGDGRAYELDCMFMGLWRCVPFSFSIFSLPKFLPPYDTNFIQGTSEQNSMVPLFPGVGLPVENTCGGKNTKVTLLSCRENPFRDGERWELFFFLLLVADWTIVNFC